MVVRSRSREFMDQILHMKNPKKIDNINPCATSIMVTYSSVAQKN